MIATSDFRHVIEQLSEYETNPITRMRCRRALRNDRVMARWIDRVVDLYDQQPSVDGTPALVDFNDLLEWIVENWDSIVKILLSLLMFI